MNLSAYSLQVVTPASAYAVTVDQLKTELSITDTVWDAKLALLIQEASEQLELATGRALLEATYCERYDRLPLDAWCPCLVHRAPLLAVSAIQYLDTAGALQTWPATEYDVDIYAEPGRIALAYTGNLPTIRDTENAFRVTYTAGYATAAAVPAAAKEFIYEYCRPRHERRPPTPEETTRLHALINASTVTL